MHVYIGGYIDGPRKPVPKIHFGSNYIGPLIKELKQRYLSCDYRTWDFRCRLYYS